MQRKRKGYFLSFVSTMQSFQSDPTLLNTIEDHDLSHTCWVVQAFTYSTLPMLLLWSKENFTVEIQTLICNCDFRKTFITSPFIIFQGWLGKVVGFFPLCVCVIGQPLIMILTTFLSSPTKGQSCLPCTLKD